MICQFTVKNFRCILEPLTLDMQATSITEHIDSVLVDDDEEKFLPLAAIYGPNGSGKSTVIKAIYSLICKIMRPICAVSCDNKECMERSSVIPIEPFSFNSESLKKPTEYELFFRTKTREYQYILKINKNKILYEELAYKRIAGYRYSQLFVRNNDSINLKSYFREYTAAELSDNLALLSYICMTHSKSAIVKDIVNWFDKQVKVLNYGNPLEESTIAIIKSNKMKNYFLDMIQEMDLDITDYRVEEVAGDKDEKDIRVFTVHNSDSKKHELKLNDESSGTIKIFGLLPHIIDSLLSGTTLLIDELDSKLHPFLLKYIIELFRNPKKNKNNAQLIFTSHDLTTMTNEVFRRDEIWFVAKNNKQASQMYSLVEFARKDAKYDKQYLEGRYGADPYFQKIINWEDFK